MKPFESSASEEVCDFAEKFVALTLLARDFRNIVPFEAEPATFRVPGLLLRDTRMQLVCGEVLG